MEQRKIKPAKMVEAAFPQLSMASGVNEIRILQLRHPMVIIVGLTNYSLELLYFNTTAFKALKYANIKVKSMDTGYWDVLTVQQTNPLYIGVKTHQNKLALYSLKSKKLICEIEHPAQTAGFLGFFGKKDPAISSCSCFARDQVITWAENSIKLCFWELTKKAPVSTLILSETPERNYALIEKRNLFILQIDKLKYIQIVDIAKRTFIKKIKSFAEQLANALNTDENLYFYSDSEMQGVTMAQIYAYSLNQKLELIDRSLSYEYYGPCPRFCVLNGGKCVSISDLRRSMILSFEGKLPEANKLPGKGCFDARGFLKIRGKKLTFGAAKDGSVWIWRV